MTVSDIERARKLFGFPDKLPFVTHNNCILYNITNQNDLVHKAGNLCLFEDYLAFYEQLPSTMARHLQFVKRH